MRPQTSRTLPCGCVQALPSGIMRQICQAHIKRLQPRPQPVAPAPGGKITYDPQNLEDMRRTFPEEGPWPHDPIRTKAEAACRIPIESNLDTRRLDRALDKIKAELEDGDCRDEDPEGG